jgi:MmeI, N-terminal domain
MTPAEFALKWMGSTQTERAASQEHFIDLCRMLDVPTPNEADPTGQDYAFEKGAEKVGGDGGFADVWKRGHFAWEYKGKRKDLRAAYAQLLQYREALENPPPELAETLKRPGRPCRKQRSHGEAPMLVSGSSWPAQAGRGYGCGSGRPRSSGGHRGAARPGALDRPTAGACVGTAYKSAGKRASRWVPEG